ncbi:beta strand repeat-containing protein, partial [Campylobacter jejuni]|uniref:beta strand repeat-containing protein n=1 Tax=Campylobacter jejuni TaxID=197 RepID=UPI003EBBD6BD
MQNSCLNSKKIVLSLATISFLASCAHATLTPEIKTYEETNRHAKARSGLRSGSTNNKTINSLQNSTETVRSTGNTLVIESGGTIQVSGNNSQAVNFQSNSSTTTFLNRGILIGGNNTASVQIGASNSSGATIETFDNRRIIGNGFSKFGITVWGNGSSKSSITNFTNSGTIHSNTGESIYFSNVNISSFTNSGTIKSNRGKGVNIVGGASIENFSNSGTIKSNSAYGVFLGNNSKATTFTNSGTINGTYSVFFDPNSKATTFTNNGAISGSSSGIFVFGGNIQTLINSGTIISSSRSTSDAGIKLERGGSIENIINTGTIKSNYSGIMVTWGKFGTLTIRDGGVVRGEYIGIGVGRYQALGDLYIDGQTKNNNTVSGVYGKSYGISLDIGSRTQTIELTNGGVIKGDISGIRLDGDASLSGEMILSGEGSRVEGGSDAGIFNFGGKIQGSITVKEGATVTATSKQAISNVGSGSITGGITVSGKNTKLEGNIINADSASIGSNIKIENGAKVEGGLVNQGSGAISGSVQVSGGSTINSITNTGSGSISGSVQVSDGSTIDSITNEGNGAISGSITVDKNSKLDSITNEGNGAISGSVQVSGGSTIDSITNTGNGAISGSITVDKNSKLDSITN